MLKVLIWRVSDDTSFQDKAIKILEQQHDGIDIIGEASDADIAKVDRAYDLILVVGAKKIGMSKITQTAHKLNLPEEKLLSDRIVCTPGFTLDKYRHLQRSQLSIIAMNCFGGLISNILDLPFRTPIINMFFEEQDYLRFLRDPRLYMSEQPILKETRWQTVLKFDYPVVTFGDVDIYMNHYRDFGEAVAKWNERKARINWYNLFVTMYTEDEKILEQFDALPYGKKACFVPFKSDLDSAWYINREITKKKYFWQTINDFAKGIPFYYDPFDMLLYGKKTPLIEM